MRIRKVRYFVGDFETAVYKGQTFTEVWASASVELNTDNVMIFNSIDAQFDYFKSLKSNLCIYYHNLKFDGAFWLSFFMSLGLKPAYETLTEDKWECGNPKNVRWLREKEMSNNTYKYSISDRGQWYSMVIKVNNIFIEIRDSLKLLPFSVDSIGKSFKTKHKKLEMEYEGFRYAGCEITEHEKEYIANDILVVKEALEIMFSEGHNSLTIGACCLKEFKKSIGKDDYDMFFPDLYDIPIDNKYISFGDYIRKSYRGGWCYLVKGKEGKIYKQGSTHDVNSLYPSMMSSESGNKYPVGNPYYWNGNIIPDEAIAENKYYFIRIKTRFYLKDGMLPFIQIKGSLLYRGTDMLETSDVYDTETESYRRYYTGLNGEVKDTAIEMVVTMTDYKLMLEHYELVDFEILDGCWFFAEIGLFDSYIEKYKHIKMNSEGAMRELAKLFLNNLYGKLASSKDSSFKLAYLKSDGVISFSTVKEAEKKAGYIACGSAITSYSRNFTIRAAQKNYHGLDKEGFIYADTDSIHCDLPPDKVVGIDVHDKKFCCWTPESIWDEAIFTRQKTYIEHITHENLKPVIPYYDIKCAGMSKKCKTLFRLSMEGGCIENEFNKYTEGDAEFVKVKRNLSDFTVGLEVPGMLKPKRIKGGIVLIEENYKMH